MSPSYSEICQVILMDEDLRSHPRLEVAGFILLEDSNTQASGGSNCGLSSCLLGPAHLAIFTDTDVTMRPRPVFAFPPPAIPTGSHGSRAWICDGSGG